MSNVKLLSSALTVAALAACAVELPESGVLEQEVQPSPVIDARRSLAITDAPILARFSLQRVMTQLTSGAAVTGPNAATSWRQLWDVFNPGPGLGAGPHCDDTVGAGGVGSLNGYPFTCRPAPAEGGQATCDPFAAGSACAYLPIGLFMRFDLAREDGGHCGEYRIVYAKDTGRTDSNDRALVIFEASMRNPHFNQGIRGCQKLVRAWAELSEEPSLTARADLLEEIYFDGWKEFDPVVQWSNFGDNPYDAGQVRTNQFVQPLTLATRVWSLRELKLRRVCAPACTLRWVPVTDKTNPFGALFAVDGSVVGGNTAAFQTELVDRVPGLIGPSIAGIGLRVSDVFNSGQSQATSSTAESNFVLQFGAGPPGFRSALQAKLTALASPLTPDHVVARAQAMSCAGCHRFSNNADLGAGLVWPPSLGFTHVSERDADLEVVGGVTRFKLSPALIDSLLPARAALVTDYLNEVPHPVRPPDAPLGGRWVH